MIYIVEAYFEKYDSSSSTIIGIFTDKDKAESTKDKWDSFFKSSKSIFDEPDNFVPNNDEDWGLIEDWKDSMEYYNLLSKYNDISKFSDIGIREFPINKDCLIEHMDLDNSSDMMSLLRQWDRDYKLKNIL